MANPYLACVPVYDQVLLLSLLRPGVILFVASHQPCSGPTFGPSDSTSKFILA